MNENATPAKKTPRGRPFAPGNPGGPGRRPRADAAYEQARIESLGRLDGWANLLTQVGVEGRDKRIGHKYYGADYVAPDVARALWEGDPEVARLIERPAEDATREGFEIDVPGDEDASRMIADEWRRLGLVEVVQKSLEFRRAYGGGAVLLGVDDGIADWRVPLNDDRARGLKWVRAIEARELTPAYYYGDPLAEKYGEVAIWQYTPQGTGTVVPGAKMTSTGSVLIHESRLVRFDGVRTSSRAISYGMLPGWGTSILTRCWAAIRDFAAAFDSSGLLVQNFGQDVYKIKGLAQILATDNGSWFRNRVQGINLARGALGMLLVDSEHEDFVRTTASVTGLDSLLRLHMERVAAAAEMPVTLFWGISPGGLNATGESDMRGYYDRTKSSQMRHLVPPLERISGMIARGLGITVPEGKRIAVTPCPLWQESDGERATARNAQADADTKYVTLGVLSPDEVRAARFGGGSFSFETTIEADDDVTPDVLPGDDPAELEAGLGVQPDDGDDIDDPAPIGSPSPAPMPGMPAAAPAQQPVALEPAKTAFTGVQVNALVDVVRAATAKEISRESAAAIIELAFPVDAATAVRILGPETFKPAEPEPPPTPFGGGAPTGPDVDRDALAVPDPDPEDPEES